MKMRKNKWFTMEYDSGNNEAEIYIFGDITEWEWLESDVSSWSIARRLQDIPMDAKITVHVNSYGGEVKEGLGIYNALRSRNVTTICDGFAASAASVIFCAGKRRIMNQASLLFVHQALAVARGNADTFEKEAQDLNKITESAVRAYIESGVTLSEEEIWSLLKWETWISAKEALEWGFATEIAAEKEENTVKNDARKSLMAAVLGKQKNCTGATAEQVQGLEKKLDVLKDILQKNVLATSPPPDPAGVGNRGFFNFK